MSEENPVKEVIEEVVEDIIDAPGEVKEGVKESLVMLKFIANIALLYLGRLPAVFVGMISGETKDD